MKKSKQMPVIIKCRDSILYGYIEESACLIIFRSWTKEDVKALSMLSEEGIRELKFDLPENSALLRSMIEFGCDTYVIED